MGKISNRDQLRAILPDANPITEAKVFDHLDEQAKRFISMSPFLLLATTGKDGFMEVSPKGDGPGSVLVLDENTIVLPDRSGNNLAFGLENMIDNPNVGLLFMIPGTTETLRISGTAKITNDVDLCKQLGPEAKPPLLAIKITVTRSFFHCAKAFLRSHLWKPETWPDKQKISFGTMIAKNMGMDDAVAEQIDTSVERSYVDFGAQPGD